MSKNGLRLWKIRLLWEDEDFHAEMTPPYKGFPEDMAFVKEISESTEGNGEDRFAACQLISGYHMLRSEYDLAIEYLRAALSNAGSHWQRALCHRNIFAYLRVLAGDRDIDDEQADHYESFVTECFLGIRDGDTRTVDMVLEEGGMAEKMEDHALLAAAARTWSLSQQNWNVVEQVKAANRYQQEILAFQQEDPRLLESPWGKRRKELLAQVQESVDGENSNNKEQRQLYLSLCAAVEKVLKTEPPWYVCSRIWAGASEDDYETAQALKREAERFREKYSPRYFNVLAIPMEGLEEYICLARKYIRQLLDCNSFVTRDISEDPSFFTDMWDYLIPAAASLLWASDITNRDVAKRREAGEQGKYWIDIFFGVMVGPFGRPFLFEKWERRGLEQCREREEEWTGLLKDVVRRLS